MKEYDRYLIKVHNIKEARRLLKKLKNKSNIKWENGLELDNEYILNLIYGEVESVGYLAIRGNVSYWLDEEEYFQAPEEFKFFDFYMKMCVCLNNASIFVIFIFIFFKKDNLGSF